MITLTDNINFLPTWSTGQWVALWVALLLAGGAALLIYLLFFAIPREIIFIGEGEDVMQVWREVMDRRAERRGRISKGMVLWLGLALGLLTGAGGLIAWAF